MNTQAWAAYLKFDLCSNDPELVKLLEGVARFMRAVRDEPHPRWLSLIGSSGVGKTYLARKIWNWYSNSKHCSARLNEDGSEIVYGGEFVHWPSVAKELQSGRGTGWLDDLIPQKLIVLDEIGATHDKSGYATDKLSTLLSCRVGKWTVITANLSLQDVAEKLDTRIASRMLRDGSEVVEVNTKDYNLR